MLLDLGQQHQAALVKPPGADAPTSDPITGTGANAETKPTSWIRATKWNREETEALVGRIIDQGWRRDIAVPSWLVRRTISILRESGEIQVPTDEDIARALMRANAFRKPTTRKWRVGEGGGWAVRS